MKNPFAYLKVCYNSPMQKTYYVYILSNKSRRVLYVGVTNSLKRRLYEHQNALVDGFTKKYNVHDLVYYEQTADAYAAICREKQIKGWTRAKKEDLIRGRNPEMRSLEI